MTKRPNYQTESHTLAGAKDAPRMALADVVALADDLPDGAFEAMLNEHGYELTDLIDDSTGEALTEAQLKQVEREERATRTARNRQFARQKLESCGFAFTIHNEGHHYIVRHSGRVFDYWPGTGKWRERNLSNTPGQYRSLPNRALQEGRGIFELLKALGWVEKGR